MRALCFDDFAPFVALNAWLVSPMDLRVIVFLRHELELYEEDIEEGMEDMVNMGVNFSLNFW